MSLSIENYFAILVSSVKKFWHSCLGGVSISIPSRGKDSSELDRSNDKILENSGATAKERTDLNK